MVDVKAQDMDMNPAQRLTSKSDAQLNASSCQDSQYCYEAQRLRQVADELEISPRNLPTETIEQLNQLVTICQELQLNTCSPTVINQLITEEEQAYKQGLTTLLQLKHAHRKLRDTRCIAAAHCQAIEHSIEQSEAFNTENNLMDNKGYLSGIIKDMPSLQDLQLERQQLEELLVKQGLTEQLTMDSVLAQHEQHKQLHSRVQSLKQEVQQYHGLSSNVGEAKQQLRGLQEQLQAAQIHVRDKYQC